MPIRHNVVMRPRQHYIREWREARKWSLLDLASKIELKPGESISDTYLGRVERHERPYTQVILEEAAKAFNCDILDLFELPSTPDRPEDDLTRHVKKLKSREDRAKAARILAAAFEDDAEKKGAA